MSKGKVVEIHLIDGTASGLRIVKILGKTTQGFACSRTEIQKLLTRPEISKPGVYLLIGKVFEKDSFYVGETENLGKRIKDHMNKEFWYQVILFNSTDKKLNKGYVKFLEASIIKELKTAGRVDVENTTIPRKPALSDAEIDYLLQFQEDIFLVLGALGFPDINKVVKYKSKALEEVEKQSLESMEDYIFYLIRQKEGKIATLVPISNGLMLMKGAKFIKPTESFLNDPGLRSSRNRRKKLLKDGLLVQEGEFLILQEDTLFNSPSGASEVVLGRSSNGRIEWKTAEGETFADIETRFLEK